jgi:hypothetical protein
MSRMLTSFFMVITLMAQVNANEVNNVEVADNIQVQSHCWC